MFFQYVAQEYVGNRMCHLKVYLTNCVLSKLAETFETFEKFAKVELREKIKINLLVTILTIQPY